MRLGYSLGYGAGVHDNLGDNDSPVAVQARWRQLRDTFGVRARQPRDPVTYHLNAESWRAPEFDSVPWQDTVVFLGCSEIFGIGIGEESTVNSQYSRATGIPSVNMGKPGAGNGEIAHIAELVLNMTGVQPRAWVVAWSMLDRYFVWVEGEPYTVTPWNVDQPSLFPSEHTYRLCREHYLRFVLEDGFRDHFGEMRQRFHRVADLTPVIEYSAIDRAVADLLGQTWWDTSVQPEDLARDGYHSNGDRNRRIVNQLLQEYPVLPGYRR